MGNATAPTTLEPTDKQPFPDELGYKPLSQTQLIWRRFRRHKLGMIGGITILFLAFVFLFAEFISPYNYTSLHKNFPYVPPMITRIHFDGLRPYVYGLAKRQACIDRKTQVVQYCRDFPAGANPERMPGVWVYKETDQKYYLKLFVRGEEYKLFGFIPTNIHLFGTGEPKGSPGQFFPFGTDKQGRDLFSMILFGGRVTLSIAPMVILISFLVGMFLGGLSGYLGGSVDMFLQRLAEIVMSLPRLALLLAISGIVSSLGQIPPMVRFWTIVGLLSMVSWAPIARVIRGQFLALRESEYTQAARALGANNLRIIFRHILPNIMSYLVVAATLAVPDVIILESILSFLGYGIQHPLTSWGMLLHNLVGQGFQFEIQFHSWLLIPAAFIVITVLAFNFLGDALRDAVDPYTVAEVKEEAR